MVKKWTRAIGILGVFLTVFILVLVGCKKEEKPQVVLINLGDSYANGVQSGGGNVNQFTQVNSYPQVLADQMRQAVKLTWNNPLLDMNKLRLDASAYPYNVGVDGATVQSLLQQTSDEWDYIDELLQPIPSAAGKAVTQLEAAEFVAGRHPGEDIKIITLFIGGNDVMGTVIAGGGTELTAPQINAFLNDQTVGGDPLDAGHDLASVKDNLTTVVGRLAGIPNSHIFMANLPSVTGIAGLFSSFDVERLAVYDNPMVTALAADEYMGFVPVGGFGVLPGLAPALAADDATLNATIAGTLAAGGSNAFSLTADEAAIIDQRIDAINAHIHDLVARHDNVYLADMVSFFDDVLAGNVKICNDIIDRGFGGGLFSLDGFHPSNTGYALIADVFIDSINASGLLPEIDNADLKAIWTADPYRDNDGDGYVPGPEDLSIIDLTFVSFLDCNDDDPDVYAPFPTGGMGALCP